MMKKTIILLAFVILSISKCPGQTYEHAAGVRAGYSSGLNYKYYFDKSMALEADALYNRHGFQFTALYEYQVAPFFKDQWQFYGGAGLHTGNWSNEFALGAALVAGTEFIFRKAPIIIGLDWKPMLNLYKYQEFAVPDLAANIRIILK